MSDLICVAFKDKDTADCALNELREMQREYLIDLEDARQGCGLNLARHVNSSPGFTPGMVPGNLTSPARSAAKSCVRSRLKLSLR